MRLSILMPTHERPETLALAIESVRRQKFQDWELLVCGDGCGPATEAVVSKAMRADPRVLWFPQPKGPGFGYANRNTVLAHARGDLIGFAAHDNLVFPDHWHRMATAFDDPAIMIASSSAAWVDDSGRVVPTVFNLADPAIRHTFLHTTANRMPANAFVYRAELHRHVGMWDTNVEKGGDRDLWSRIILHCGDHAFRYLPYIGFLHFRAIWKTAAGIRDPHTEGVWTRIFATPGRLPATLHQPVPDNTLPQNAFFRLLHGPDGDAWAATLRQACALAIESFACEAEHAWHESSHSLRESSKALEKSQAKLAKAETRINSRDQQIARLKAKLKSRQPWWRKLLRR